MGFHIHYAQVNSAHWPFFLIVCMNVGEYFKVFFKPAAHTSANYIHELKYCWLTVACYFSVNFRKFTFSHTEAKIYIQIGIVSPLQGNELVTN